MAQLRTPPVAGLPIYTGPTGITNEERQFARTLGFAFREGEGQNWQVLSQLRPPAYPNSFRKEDYLRLAVSELVRETERTQGPVGNIPTSEDLTRAEKATVRRVRARILEGKDIAWDDLLGRVGSQYPNQLTKRQVLLLAALQSSQPRAQNLEGSNRRTRQRSTFPPSNSYGYGERERSGRKP